MKRRIACVVMALVLVIGLLPLGAISTKAASYLNYSENLVNLIKQFEGFSASAYWDVNQWTIGYGTTGYAGQTISEAEADLVLRDRLNTINAKINDFTAKNNLYLNQYQHDALVSFSFNCNTDWMNQVGRFNSAVTRGADVNTFLFAISLWANMSGTPDANLINRRLAEANLYLNGVYSKSAPANYTYVILDPNGGVAGENGEDKMQAYVNNGTNVNILAANPTRSGATFGGWFTAPSGGTGVKVLNSTTAGRTLYAQYGTPVTVTAGYAAIRNGAGTNYSQVATAASGTQLVIVETATVGNVQWGRCVDGWVEMSNTNASGTVIVGGTTGTTTGTTTGSTSTTAVATGMVVAKSGVNVRAGAGTNYSVVGSAYNGQQVTIYETVNVGGTLWGRIGVGRWICLSYVKLNSSIPGTSTGTTTGTTTGGVIWEGTGTTTPTTTTYQLGVVTASGLNVRVAPGVGNATCGALKKGAQVKIYAQTTVNNVLWGKVDQGWVCMNYIQLTSTGTTGTTGTTTTTGTPIATGTVKANTNLNVRNGAGVGYARVGSLTSGTAVNIYERVIVNGAEWGRIGTNQWVCMAYLVLNNTNGTVVTPGTSGTTTATTGTGTVISSTGLNVRIGAGANYQRVSSLTPGSQVTIYEVVQNGSQLWGRIGVNQWVCMTYIRMNGTTTGTTTTIPSTGYQGRVTTNMNVRAAAGTNNAIVGRLTAGTTVVVYELTSVNGVSWGRIANGWVCMNYIQLTTTGGVTWH